MCKHNMLTTKIIQADSESKRFYILLSMTKEYEFILFLRIAALENYSKVKGPIFLTTKYHHMILHHIYIIFIYNLRNK